MESIWLTGAFHGALNARTDQHGPGAALLVAKKENLGGVAIALDDLADRSIRRNDSHVASDTVALAAVDFDGVACGAGAGADPPAP